MLHVAPFEGPLVVLLKRHGANPSDDRRVVWGDAHHVCAAHDLGAQPLQWIPAVDLSLEQSVRGKIIKASTSLSAQSIWEPSLRMLPRS